MHIVLPRELLIANRGVAFLTKANALKLNGDRLIAKPLEESALCVDEWIAARADDSSRLVSEFVRAFVTRSTLVLKPSQMVLRIGKGACRRRRARRRNTPYSSSGAKKLIGFR